MTKEDKNVIISVQGMRNNMVDAESQRQAGVGHRLGLGNCRCTNFVHQRNRSLRPALVLFVFSYILKIGDSIVQSLHGWNMFFTARNEEQNNVDIG